MSLRLSRSLSLPLDVVTSTIAVLAKKGAGKTFTVLALVERMIEAGQQVVIADPLGVCWGLRSSADGKAEGLPVIIMGGSRGDVALNEHSGAEVARFVVGSEHSVILDMSEMSTGQAVRFMTDFSLTLFHLNKKPVHIVLDEADEFAPQSPMGEKKKSLDAVDKLVRRGRAKGIGVTLVTQRPAVLHKNVLTQAEILFVLRITAPQDRAAVEAWVQVHGTPEQKAELLSSLPRLGAERAGEFWCWSPMLDIFVRTRAEGRKTFDSSATPKIGAATRRDPVAFAQVDLDTLRERLESAVEEKRQNDPRELRKEIAILRKELIAARKGSSSSPEQMRAAIAAATGPLESRVQALEHTLDEVGRLASDISALLAEVRAMPREPRRPIPHPAHERDGAPALAPTRARPSPTSESLSGPQHRVLSAIAWWNALGVDAPNKIQVAFVAEYSPNSGGFNNTLGSLRTAGLIDYPRPKCISLTERGSQAAQPASLNGSLHEAVLRQLPRPQGRVLSVLLEAWPEALSKEEIASRSDYSVNSGGFNNILGRLRSLGLVEYPARGMCRASDLMFPTVGAKQ